MNKVVIPLPTTDFDPTEAAVTWKVLSETDVDITFATLDGTTPTCDHRMLTGEGLGIWSAVLKADKNGREAYAQMVRSRNFKKPIRWDEIDAAKFDGIALPGGHAPGMKIYLESRELQKSVVDFFESSKLVAAICHGVVLAARSQNSHRQSVLFGKSATALLRSQEMAAWAITCLWLGDYYRTYKETVQSEVERALGRKDLFRSGPTPFRRDSPTTLRDGFVVIDGNLITARWPGDTHRFGHAITEYLKS